MSNENKYVADDDATADIWCARTPTKMIASSGCKKVVKFSENGKNNIVLYIHLYRFKIKS